MSNFLLNLQQLIFANIPTLILWTLVFFYIWFRIIWKIEQKKLWLDNFEWWTYRGLVDMYKNQGYPYPEINAKRKIDIIIKEYKLWNSIFWNNKNDKN